MRRTFAALLIGVVLLSAGLLYTATAIGQERQQDRTLQRDAAQVASAFTAYFERARSLDLLLAQDAAFRPAGGAPISNAKANRAMAFLGKLYPGAIGEACLIDDRGHEIARVTEGVPAPIDDLSTEEAEADFFQPTLDLDEGEVYQARPYVSPDTGRWVISNSTWVRQADGRPLIVHFEVSLESFIEYLQIGGSGTQVAVVDRDSGRTILSSDAAVPATDPPGTFPHFEYAAALTTAGTDPQTVTADGRRLAVSSVAREAGNANNWVIVEWSTKRASFVPPWAGAAAATVGVALILLFLLVLRRQQAALKMAARLDHLTGMANRKALEEALAAAVSAAATSGGDQVAVIMLDLDGFKQINDTLGHDKGDLVLQEIARRLHSNTFEYDTAARLGGDEFAVVLRRLRDPEDVAAVAQRLRDALIRPIDVDGTARFIGASFGAAIYPTHGDSVEALLRSADAAMYQAKRGREGVRVYDAGTATGATESSLAAELLLAIENDELRLAFQPQFSVETGCIVAIEALARWQRDGQDVPPMEFIPLAEQTGLIRPLTYVTLRRALDEARLWQEAGIGVPVSVNLSAQVVTDRSLVPDIRDMLTQRGLFGDALVLEITETSVIGDMPAAVRVLEELRATGVRVELDDFGSGYGSFKALHELPLDGVKIDRLLVNDASMQGQRLLAATIDIGRHLGLRIVAEGIEDVDALDLVRELGSDTAQGFHLARPMTPQDLRLLLSTEPHGVLRTTA